MKFTLFVVCCVIDAIYGRNDMSFRIVGGDYAKCRSAPYMCAIISTSKICGCAILTNKWVLTAAECIKGETNQDAQVLVGTRYLDDSNRKCKEKTRKHYPVQQWISHQHWDADKIINDIAVVQVNGKIEFNDQVQSIKFSNNTVPNGVDVQFFGWGRTETSGKESNRLKTLAMKTVDCLGYQHIHDGELCALAGHGEGICASDFGGPLVWNNELVGVASFVLDKVCASGEVDGFVRVSKYYKWIMEQISHKA